MLSTFLGVAPSSAAAMLPLGKVQSMPYIGRKRQLTEASSQAPGNAKNLMKPGDRQVHSQLGEPQLEEDVVDISDGFDEDVVLSAGNVAGRESIKWGKISIGPGWRKQ